MNNQEVGLEAAIHSNKSEKCLETLLVLKKA